MTPMASNAVPGAAESTLDAGKVTNHSSEESEWLSKECAHETNVTVCLVSRDTARHSGL